MQGIYPQLKNPVHSFYNESYNRFNPVQCRMSDCEIALTQALRDFGVVQATTTGVDLVCISDLWNHEFYEGSILREYVNAHSSSEHVAAFDFSRILTINELKQKDVGIRFFTSTVNDEVVADIVQYLDVNKTKPGDKARLESRMVGTFANMTCMQGIINIVGVTQSLSEEVTRLRQFIFN